MFHKNFFLDQGRKEVFHKQGSFSQLRIFTQSKNFSRNKDQKGSLKAKILDPFNTTSYAKYFNSLMLVGNKMSYILTRTISFLGTCDLLSLNIKKLILFNVLTEPKFQRIRT